MKRTAALLLVLVMICSFMPLTLAAEYKDANWLYADWDINGYPDDVGGVFSYDGDGTHLCILLLNDDGTREKEIRAMLESDANLRFGSCTRTHNELEKIKDEIVSGYMNETYGVNGCGIGMKEDGSDAAVTVRIDPEKYTDTAELLREKFGDAVIPAGGENKVSDAQGKDKTAAKKDTAESEPQPEPTEADRQHAKRQLVTYMIAYTVVVAGMAFAMYFRRKKKAEERK